MPDRRRRPPPVPSPALRAGEGVLGVEDNAGAVRRLRELRQGV